GGARLEPGAPEVRVELDGRGARTVRWPVVAGEVPPPADGTTIELRHRPGSFFLEAPPLPPPGRMEGATLVVDGVTGYGSYIAQAPDGALARLWCEQDAELGPEVAFRAPRRVVVDVRDEAGAPLAGCPVSARNQGNNELAPPATTDASGRATFDGLYGELCDLTIHGPAGGARYEAAQRSVDLEVGGAEFEVVLRRLREGTGRLALLVDGAPRLPARFRVNGAEVVEERPELGELVLRAALPDGGAPVPVYVTAPGFAGAGAELALAERGDPPLSSVHLVRTAVLIARVGLPREGYVDLTPQRYDEAQGTWGQAPELRLHNGLSFPNGPGDTFHFQGVPPGRWRVRDERTGLASTETVLVPGQASATVELELGDLEWITGRVEGVDEADLERVRVLVQRGEPAAASAWLPGADPPDGATLRLGTFRVQVHADEEVTLVAWHPWLAPAPDGGYVTLRGGAEDVVLRLVVGDELRLPAPELAGWQFKPRLARYPAGAAPTGEPLEWHHAPVVDGVLRCALPRGTWALWLDPGADYAPLVLRDVAIDGVTTLPPAALTAGTTLRIRLATEEGDPPRIYAFANALDAPRYTRQMNSDGEAVAELPGLGPGRFDVKLGNIMAAGEGEVREVTADGVADVELEYAPQ
ncbi:MAG: Ig-like domain-containing protein, partial [Planctomycetes bacterium]|nr:Ig-like domain-containing protein [Planctomycetota bacterium]